MTTTRHTDDYPRPPFPVDEMDPPGQEYKMSERPRYEAPSYRAAQKLEGSVALITGGDSGIGRAVAYLYAREGADIAFTYLQEEKKDAEETVRAIESVGQNALALKVDVSDREQCKRAVEETVKRFGRLDILVNNAAFQNHVDRFEELDPKQWKKTFTTNIDGYFYMAQAALKHLPEGGAIINTGSILGFEGSPGLVDYSATKGAIHAFTKALAQNLVSKKIRVNCVAPGPVWTPLNPAERDAESTKNFGKNTPYGRPAQPEEISPAFVFFASQDSNYITGEVLTLLGGETRAG
jgi:NAD(P)-dependent dehydrogenase (short-subunit alcohol dehydrogenase family)